MSDMGHCTKAIEGQHPMGMSCYFLPIEEPLLEMWEIQNQLIPGDLNPHLKISKMGACYSNQALREVRVNALKPRTFGSAISKAGLIQEMCRWL